MSLFSYRPHVSGYSDVSIGSAYRMHELGVLLLHLADAFLQFVDLGLYNIDAQVTGDKKLGFGTYLQ